MYPHVLKNSALHLFEDYGILFTDIGNYILNETEIYMIEKFTGEKSLVTIIDEISKEINSPDKNQIKNIIMKFIDSKTGGVLLREEKAYEPLKRTGQVGSKIPLELTLSLTNKCSLACIHCFKSCGIDRKDSINYNALINTLRFLKGKSTGIQLTGGEPMLYENFFEILKYCIDNFETTITTTGILINSSNAEKFKGIENVQLSLYSHMLERHDAVTSIHGSFEKTINAARELSKIDIPITIATILTKENIDYMDEIIDFSYRIGAKVIRFGLFVPCGRGINLRDSWLLGESDIKNVKEKLKEFSQKYKEKIVVQDWEDEERKKHIAAEYKCLDCGAGLFTWAISEKGIIKPCEFLDDAVCIIGDLNKEPVENIVKNYNFDSMADGLLKWEKELNNHNCSVKELCSQIKDYYLEHCCK